MITMITGAPGAGKSALVVKMLLDREGRPGSRGAGSVGPAFVSGIPGLKLDHCDLPPAREWTHREIEESTGTSQAKYSFPPGSLLVVDECQRVFRPRSSSSEVPDYVAALETHRHTGIDIWLVTQKPHLVDQNVRALVGRHLHLRKTWLGRQLLEWPEVVQPDSRATRAVAIRKRFKLPKSVFGLYESASLHVKQKHGVPVQAWILLGLVAGACWLGWSSYRRVHAMVEPVPLAAVGAEKGGPVSSGLSGVLGSPGVASSAALVGTRADDYKPRLVSRPETAPLYDQLRRPVAMPVVAGCMVHDGECGCYTQQATRVDVTDAVCRAWLARPPFNPYKADFVAQGSQSQVVQPVSVPSGASGASGASIRGSGGAWQPDWRTRQYVQPERTSAAGGPHIASGYGG